jgi:hypothetical protein
LNSLNVRRLSEETVASSASAPVNNVPPASNRMFVRKSVSATDAGKHGMALIVLR